MKPFQHGAFVAALCLSCASGGEGGSPSSGGTPGTSGGSPTGGTATGGNAGSSSATGGASQTGGTSTGGASVTGGASSTSGGTVTTGGREEASGGRVGAGGSTAGGVAATGGRVGAGGAAGAGGRSTTGGTAPGGASTGGNGGAGGMSSAGTRSAGCDMPIPMIPNRKTQQTVTIEGKTRFYLLNVPSSADNKTALPLVFALHGYNMNNLSLVDLYDFTAQSGNKAITVLPQGEGDDPGTTSKWGSGISSTFAANAANYSFIETLLSDIQSRFCIDKSRIFITGFSMGGLFTNSLACAHSDWFRAFAPVEGGGPGSCANKNAKPAIMIHQGTADTTVGPATGEASRDFWLKQNGCDQSTMAAFNGCTSYGNCAQPVAYCVGNWGHTVDRIAKANIWSFFASF